MTRDELRKAEQLGEYRALLRHIRWLEDERETIMAKMEGLGAQVIDDMPRATGGGRDLADLLDRFNRYDSELLEIQVSEIQERSRILKAINGIEIPSNPNVRLAMIYYYLDGLTWEAVSERLDVSIRSVYRLHRLGISAIRV